MQHTDCLLRAKCAFYYLYDEVVMTPISWLLDNRRPTHFRSELRFLVTSRKNNVGKMLLAKRQTMPEGK